MSDPAFDPDGFLTDALKSGTKGKTLDVFGAALGGYRAAFNDPLRIHAFCEDFRAGEDPDKELLLADKAAGKKIAAPTLLLWSAAHFPARPSLIEAWRDYAENLRGEAIDSGHYLAEEAPEATAAALEAFLQR